MMVSQEIILITVVTLDQLVMYLNIMTTEPMDIKISKDRNNTDSGFDKQTDLTKLRYTPANSAWNQTFEITSSNTTETSDETYIGLTDVDFAADPYQRYAVSAIDQMDNDYHRYIFTHTMQPLSNMTVTSKLYKTRYSRIWNKSDAIYTDPDGDGANTNNAIVTYDSLDTWKLCCARFRWNGYKRY